MTVVHMQPAELRYHQEMLKLARKTHSAVDELKQQEECLPLVNLFLDSVDQVCWMYMYMYMCVYKFFECG